MITSARPAAARRVAGEAALDLRHYLWIAACTYGGFRLVGGRVTWLRAIVSFDIVNPGGVKKVVAAHAVSESQQKQEKNNLYLL